MSDAEELLRRIVLADPVHAAGDMDWSYCGHCDGNQELRTAKVGNSDLGVHTSHEWAIVHQADCPWVLGRRLLGLVVTPDEIVIPAAPTPGRDVHAVARP